MKRMLSCLLICLLDLAVSLPQPRTSLRCAKLLSTGHLSKKTRVERGVIWREEGAFAHFPCDSGMNPSHIRCVLKVSPSWTFTVWRSWECPTPWVNCRFSSTITGQPYPPLLPGQTVPTSTNSRESRESKEITVTLIALNWAGKLCLTGIIQPWPLPLRRDLSHKPSRVRETLQN